MRVVVRVSQPTTMLPPCESPVSEFKNEEPSSMGGKDITMYRIVHIVGQNGTTYEVPMTAEQASYYHRLAEFRATTDPKITFGDVVVEKKERELQSKSKRHN